jgi:rhodanese-related sulfurtransferase
VALGLRQAGYTNVKVLQGPNAFGQWQSAGYPVETGQ